VLDAHPTRARHFASFIRTTRPAHSSKREEATTLLNLASERDLAIVSDEVFTDYALGDDPDRFASFASDTPALAFALGGLSKVVRPAADESSVGSSPPGRVTSDAKRSRGWK